ncbi:hypothetical protein DQ04_01881130 [Trypanosoma grayi]|uniref:hypothetical protein n=1 Tax=Trypanosoma grayi TaxID=71804 RepID=UPI0004F40537|nr:hypothetical protein DQ04_01881130 [Trypanosoma grayi]KEG12229.1 hypothetical protein DQ04_01881130 [Trypanosoma grayi]
MEEGRQQRSGGVSPGTIPHSCAVSNEKRTPLSSSRPVVKAAGALKASVALSDVAKVSPAPHQPQQPKLSCGEEVAASESNAVTRDARLREKYAVVKNMRAHEAREALGRECELSHLIIELKKRLKEMEVSHNVERETHARESFYLIKENEGLKEQVRLAEKMLTDARSSFEAEMQQMRTQMCDLKQKLHEEWLRATAREAEHERVVQHLCSSLHATQAEMERYAEENRELASVKEALRNMTAKCVGAQEECSLWHEVLRRREVFLLLEREMLVELQSDCARTLCSSWRQQEEPLRARVSGDANRVIASMRSSVDVYDEVKRLLLEDATASVERAALVAQHRSSVQEALRLGEKHEALSAMFAQCMRDFDATRDGYLENVAWLKTLDDATLSYVLRQRDDEVADKLRTWKDALLEAHRLLRALLMRYEPFQRGDEDFVKHVIECLASAPHVKDPVNVWLH